MFTFRPAFALLSICIAFDLVMTAPIPVPEGDEAGFAPISFHTYNRKIDGKDVKLMDMPTWDQAPLSSTYYLVDGWAGNLPQSAIVRIWKTQDTNLLGTIETSVGFLKDPAVGLLYHSEKNTLNDSNPKEYEYVIATKNMHYTYPMEGAPRLARLYEWFHDDQEMDLAAATEQVRKASIKKAEDMANEQGIVFCGITAQTVWTNKERDIVYFSTYDDAVRIKGDVNSGEAKKALDQMRKNAEENYTEANIRQATEPLFSSDEQKSEE